MCFPEYNSAAVPPLESEASLICCCCNSSPARLSMIETCKTPSKPVSVETINSGARVFLPVITTNLNYPKKYYIIT